MFDDRTELAINLVKLAGEKILEISKSGNDSEETKMHLNLGIFGLSLFK